MFTRTKLGFFPFSISSDCCHEWRLRAHLVVEHSQAVQGVQVLLQQGCSCWVQIHLIQLQHSHGHPEQSLVHRGVLGGEKEPPFHFGVSSCGWKTTRTEGRVCPARSRFCPQPQPFQGNRCSYGPVNALHRWTVERKLISSLVAPPKPFLLSYIPSLLTECQINIALCQPDHKWVCCSQSEHGLQLCTQTWPGTSSSKSEPHTGGTGIQHILGLLSRVFSRTSFIHQQELHEALCSCCTRGALSDRSLAVTPAGWTSSTPHVAIPPALACRAPAQTAEGRTGALWKEWAQPGHSLCPTARAPLREAEQNIPQHFSSLCTGPTICHTSHMCYFHAWVTAKCELQKPQHLLVFLILHS